MKTRTQVTSLFQKFAGQSATLVIPRPYIDFCEGDHLAALLLSQILYWSERTADPDGWFAKSYDDWYEEIGLTDRQVKRIVKGDKRRQDDGFSLESIGVKTKLARSDYYQGAATLHYCVDHEVLSAKINAFSQVPTIARNDQCGIPPIAQNDDPPIAQNDHIHRLHTENINLTGAEKAPDADTVIPFDDMLAELNITQADLDATPLDEIIPDPPKPQPKTKTPHNLMFEAICGVFDYDWNKITKSKRGQVNAATKQLNEADAVPDDIPKLHAYCMKQGYQSFGPLALATNWDDLKAERQASTRPSNGASAEPVTFIHDKSCNSCNYGMVIDETGKSVQCAKCAVLAKKEIV